MHGVVFNDTPATETTRLLDGSSRRMVRAIKGYRLSRAGRKATLYWQGRYVEQEDAALCQAG